MKILMLTASLPRKIDGAMAERAGALAQALAGQADLTLLCRRDGNNAAPKIWAANGIDVITATSAAQMHRLLQQALSDRNDFDAVLVAHTQLYPYWRDLRRRPVVKILDLYDCVEYNMRHRSQKAGLLQRLRIRRARRHEEAMIQTADLALVPSLTAYDQLSAAYPHLAIQHIPHGFDPAKSKRLPRAWSRDIVLAGTAQVPPDTEAAIFFYKKALPFIGRQYQEVRFTVMGGPITRELRKLDDNSRTFITGEVDDIRPYYEDGEVCIAPRGSDNDALAGIVAAMALGRPVVATSQAAEALGLQHGRHLLIANSPDRIVKAVNRIFSDERVYASLTDKAREWAARRHAWSTLAARIIAGIESRHAADEEFNRK